MFLKRSAMPLTILLLVGCGGDSEITDPAPPATPPPPVTPPPPPPPSPLQEEREALAALYHAMGGDSWKHRDNWLTDAPMVDWYGVGVHGGNGRVHTIDLRDNGLTGSIPPEIGSIERLVVLSLQDNHLTGSIPPELGKLALLEYLDVGGNGLTGSIPPEIGNLRRLISLSLTGNQLTGTIPAELAKAAQLEVLEVADNALIGSIPPELGSLSLLRRLTLGVNDLAGAIPEEIGNAKLLEAFRVDQNPRLSGLMPRSLLNLKELVDLAARGTGLCAPLDPGFREWMKRIRYLRVEECDVGVVERMALTELFERTGGGAWENAAGWKTDADLASWSGVTVEDGRVHSDMTPES